jgi:phage terminase small subunit
MKRPRPPAGLTAEAKNLWNRTLANWPVGREETLLCCLRSACLALDRLRVAEAALARDGGGGVYQDRWGQPRQHPVMLVIRDSAKQLRDDLKMLSLDWEVLNRGKDEPGREFEIPEPEGE